MKKIEVLLLLLCIVFLYGFPLYAQDNIQHYFKTLDIKNGLSQNTIFAILQDRQGFMWFGTKEGLNRFDGQSFRVFKKEESGLGNDFITALFEDRKGKIWVGTDAGVYIYDPIQEKFTAFNMSSNTGEVISQAVTKIGSDGDNNIWISVDYQGLFQYDIAKEKLSNYLSPKKSKKTLANISHFWFDGKTCWMGLFADNLYFTNDDFKTLLPFRDADGKETFKNEIITARLIGSHNCWYIGSSSGLTEINLTTLKTRRLIDCYVRDLEFSSDKELWVGTENGLYICHLDNGTTEHLTDSNENDLYSLADNAIYSIYRDREAGMWMGSFFGGINYQPYPYTYFEKFYSGRIGDFGKRVREFCESNDGTIWIGTEDCGLFNYNPISGEIKPFRHPAISHNVHGLCLDGDFLWLGNYLGGLSRIDLRTKQVKHYQKGTTSNSLDANDIMSICKSTSGDLWLGTIHGLMLYNHELDNFTSIPQLANKNIYHILEDSHGNVWVSTYASGIFRYDIKLKEWKNFCYQASDPNSLPYNKVTGCYEDSRNRLWIMTQGGGFCRYNPENESFIRYGMAHGFPSNTIYRMEEDDMHNLWLTTNNGLVCLNPETNEKRIYTTDDGLLCNQFNYQSSFKDKKGRIYFGCINGFIAFAPDMLMENPFNPPIIITDLSLFNNRVVVGDENSPLQKSILFSDKIQLQPNQNSFSLHVAALNYQSPSTQQLIYQLDGFSNKWTPVENNFIINYSNLPYGTYTLRLKLAKNKNISGANIERTLEIEVLPPFYLSKWAYFIYGLFSLVSVFLLLYYFQKRNKETQIKLIEKIKQEKERDLYSAKIDFFTDVTHEIRTPLTLIKGPLENVLSYQKLPDEIREDLEIMNLNTNRLLELVNQLLDFRKAEIHGFRLKFEECNITEILQQTNKRFTSLALQKKLKYTIEGNEQISASVDQEALIKIISNLLTNAIKYSETYIHIRLWTEKDCFLLSVCNDGKPIPENMKEEIFKPFIQYKNEQNHLISGTGIGLALARSLTELHYGTLIIDQSMDCNRFILSIPITHHQSDVKDLSEKKNIIVERNEAPITIKMAEVDADNKKLLSILVVEDNIDMQTFITRQLSSWYNVVTAKNGIEALEVLKHEEIKLVISDVMMPEMDGLKLCNRLKEDVNYSHIPIILLTAKVSLQAKIDGLKSGADAYIEKPFSLELLKTSIDNLLESRKRLYAASANSPFIPTNSAGMTEADQKFLQTLSQTIEANMQDPEFDLDKMAEWMNMSRSSMNRKIKGILNMTPNDYIRLERLKKAALLLKKGEYRINEVCYMVGFNTPSYFAKCFQKQFGTLPKDF
ncbi:hybrid sensor histidine kinase/response regulator transcription factor [Bacteroides sp.]|uniref:hybrid sensor histidine kinase/response regulator transcription factor n=1 Tax=Bacteroides sp. TaxID=29523 RepID=UPI00260C272C|nr:hybrid sensor histidine kinase/response regulator transcription factor [Bacteroides sp.]MDD3036887.1 two-component regulator propeller domain-containing protein [Bacteroides sp.]